MRFALFLLLPLIHCASLPIEPQKNEFRLTNFNPFKFFASDQSRQNSHSTSDQDPFVNLLRNSFSYLAQSTNATLGFIDRTSENLRTKLKATKNSVQQTEIVESEPLEAVIIPSPAENQTDPTTDSPLLESVKNEFEKLSRDTEPTEHFVLQNKPKEERDFFSAIFSPWTFMEQVDGPHEHADQSLFVGKHNPYDLEFWTEEDGEIVVLPQKISVYPKEENEVSNDVQTTTIQPTLKIEEIPTNETEKVASEEKKQDDEKTEDVPPINDPLKLRPIELENFVGQNVTIKRNESIKFNDNILVSYPPANSIKQFYNLATSKLKEAAPNLSEVRVDGGYVQTISNETDNFTEELQFLHDNLKQIQNSLFANNIKIQSFDYVVWFFEDQEEKINQKERAETLATYLQARVYPHIFTQDLMECRVELPSDYSNINLTVYIARKSESALALAPSKERLPYYKTLLSALDPFLQFLKALQKSMGAVSRSMQKWVQNGQPLAIEKKKTEIELRRATKFEHKVQKPAHHPILEFFDQPFRRQLNFVNNLQNSIKIESVLKED